jgi:UrcA family protein
MARSLIAAALFTLLATSPALGADDDLTRIVVPYGDLDLHSTAGQDELTARVFQAATSLCRPAWMRTTPDSEFTAHYREVIYHACVGRVTNRAMDSIENAR